VKTTPNDHLTISHSEPEPPEAFNALLHRIGCEYDEMPGMCVTGPQAQRLWGLDSSTCASVLMTLVQRGILRRTARGSYVKQ